MRRRSLVRCDCGKEFVAINKYLLNGSVKSCGCLRADTTAALSATHLMSDSRTYGKWQGMHTRCTNPNRVQFKDWGGRGIKVCERWMNFEKFLEDMGECPPGLELDRWPDQNGNYEKSNCRWATRKQQMRNTRKNRIFTVRGITGCLPDLCDRFGVSYKLVAHRLYLKDWTPEEAFFTPVLKIRKPRSWFRELPK